MSRRVCLSCPTVLPSLTTRMQCLVCLERQRVSDWSFADRLRQAMGARARTAGAVAGAVRTSTATVEQWAQGRVVPRGALRARIEAWLIPGSGVLTARASARHSTSRTG